MQSEGDEGEGRSEGRPADMGSGGREGRASLSSLRVSKREGGGESERKQETE